MSMGSDTTLPQDMIEEILLRLPVRSLLRLKCVCKAWHALISDHKFRISHYDLAAAPSHRLLLRSDLFYVESFDIEAPLPENSSAVNLPLFLPSPPRSRDHYSSNFRYEFQYDILGSCRGLILIYDMVRNERGLILWNPSIGVHKCLSNYIPSLTCTYSYGFGYESSIDDYLLVLLDCSSHLIRIYSFQSNFWRDIYIHLPYRVPHQPHPTKCGTLFNENLHWLVFRVTVNVPVILAFSLRPGPWPESPHLSEIPLPFQLNSQMYYVYNLSVLGGCLSVGVCSIVQGCLTSEIWVMKEYKLQSSWTKTIKIPAYGFFVICSTKDGGMYVSNNRGLQKINHMGELLDHLLYDVRELFCANLPSALYRESLLPLPSVIRETTEDDQQ